MGVGAGYTVTLKSISTSKEETYSYGEQSFDEDEITLKKGNLHAESGRIEVSEVSHPYWGFTDVEMPCVDIDMPLPDAVIHVDSLDESQVLDLITVLLKAGATSDYEGDDLDNAEESLEYLRSLLVGFTGKLDAKELFGAIDSDLDDMVHEYVYDFSEWDSGVLSGGYLWCRPDGMFSFEGSANGVSLLDQNSRYTNGIEFKSKDFQVSFKSDELASAIVECHDMYDEEDEDGYAYSDWLEDLRNRY